MTSNQQFLKTKLKQSDIRKIYKRISPYYDIWSSLVESKTHKRSLKIANLKDGHSVLEVAVGTGYFFSEIVKRNLTGRNEGIDITPEMINKAKKKLGKLSLSNYTLKTDDVFQLNYPENTFDFIFCNYMFDLLPEDQFIFILQQFKKILRSNGCVLIINTTQGTHWYHKFWEILYKIHPVIMAGSRGISLSQYLVTAGFSDVKKEFISRLTYPSELVYGTIFK
ncbi:MAG: methyltransferase domain-containing protein [Spirochaetota bacterium]|nr:methyltransferase domain-containing protein [Spirochaetota bacterium]